MLNRRSTFSQNLSNRKGQVALFVALIFQILFLFFAMVINVGLLVHHKINLQNSVDLAAYYGAMKQAENMNAIGHINYQIRQSWKLLAFRYRMLGSAGEWDKHPFDKATKNYRTDWDQDTVSDTDPVLKDFQEAPAFCITYVPFKPMPAGENTCRNMATFSGIKLFSIPPVIAGHQAFSSSIASTARVLLDNATRRCVIFGSYNYFMLAKFVVAYNYDQAHRMDTIAALSRATSQSEEDFYDLDGELVSEGIKATLRKNLTPANRDSLGDNNIKIFNSLGADGCNSQGLAEAQPAKWLNPIRVYPGFSYIDTKCDGTAINLEGKELTGDPASFPHHINTPASVGPVPAGLVADIKNFADFVGFRSNLNDNYNFSIGVEKNPWCMAYVGVSAQTQPRIPFSPFGQNQLKARAFFKPFGGRIGPWYQSKWPRGSEMSSQGERTDPLLPPRVTDLSALPAINNDPANKKTRAANYSRFVGDKFGLQSRRMLAVYGRSIYELDPVWRSAPPSTSSLTSSEYTGKDAPNFEDWSDLPFKFYDTTGDLLAWDGVQNVPSTMRRLELISIIPDAFDLAYYSIEPDFYNLYYERIRTGFFTKFLPSFDKNRFRPDLGYRKGFKQGSVDYTKFNVKQQMEVLKSPDLNVPWKDKFTFISENWQQLLTSWSPLSMVDFSLNPATFGKCEKEAIGGDKNAPAPATSGNCVIGGSTGYSVKMVASDYLRSDELVLGGEGTGSGPLKNKPPEDEDF